MDPAAIMAQLGQAGAGPPAPPDAGPSPMDQQYGQGSLEDVKSILAEMLQLADEFRQQEGDQANLLAMEQVRTLVQKILAAEQKNEDDLTQGKASPSAIRRYA